MSAPLMSPLLRPPSRSISGGSSATGSNAQGSSSGVGGTSLGSTTATSTSHVVYARPRGLSNRTHSNRDLKLQTVPPAASPDLGSANFHHHDLSSSPMSQTGSSSGATNSLTVNGQSPPGKNSRNAAAAAGLAGRKRSSSIVSVQEIPETYDEMLDQETLANSMFLLKFVQEEKVFGRNGSLLNGRAVNTDWVNFKGAWVIHIVLLVIGKVIVDIIPGMNQTISWTIVLQLYMLITFLMFHWVTGTPFSANGGAFDRLTFWEQIDHGAQNTPARKFLMSLPIGLFLLTTHYVRYDLHPTLFTINLVSLLLFGLAPKLPQAHRVRLRFFDDAELPSVGSTASLDQLARDKSRGGSPNPGRVAPSSISLTETNVKSLDGSSRGPPTPIEEESEPQTPVDGRIDSPSLKRRFLS